MSEATESAARTVRLWRAMTPEQRDYDRLVARSVPAAVLAADPLARVPETREAFNAYFDLDEDEDGTGCSCHLAAPCSWCLTHCPDCGERVPEGDHDTHACAAMLERARATYGPVAPDPWAREGGYPAVDLF